jgi:integrase
MPHDLRRTFATTAEQVVSYSELKRLMNHSTDDDVTQGYITITAEKLRAPMQRVTDALLAVIQK